MKKVLWIDACVRPDSRTRRLTKHILKKLDGEIEILNLEREVILPLTGETLAKRDSLLQRGDFSAPMLRYARQFACADVIVLAAPYWDLSFPASVKAYMEAITVTGVTFCYTEEGYPSGLCRAEKLIYVTTAGGFIGENDFGFRYVETMAKSFFGIQDVVCVRAEGLDIAGADVEGILKEAETAGIKSLM